MIGQSSDDLDTCASSSSEKTAEFLSSSSKHPAQNSRESETSESQSANTGQKTTGEW